MVNLNREDIVYIKRVLREACNALNVLEEVTAKDRIDIRDKYAVRYAIIEIIESIALISHRIAKKYDYPLEGYTDAMKFLHEAGILEKDVVDQLVRLARLRNPLMHKYWEINDERIIREARERTKNH